MKTRFAIVLLFLTLTGWSLKAQSYLPENRWTFGAKTGVTLSTVDDYAPKFDSEYRFGYTFSLFADYKLSGKLFFQPALSLTKKGVNGSQLGTSESNPDGDEVVPALKTDEKVNMLFVELPLLFGYKFDVSDKCKIFLQAGPYISVGFAGKTKIDVNGFNQFSYDTFGRDRLSRSDIGLMAGVGAELWKHMLVNFQYGHGLKPLKESSLEFNSPKIRAYYLTVGYIF